MRAPREILDDLMPLMPRVAELVAELDAAVPPPPPPPPTTTGPIVRVLPGEDAQALYASLFPTGGVLELAPGHHPHSLVLPKRATPIHIIVRGVGATLRGFTSFDGHRSVFEDVGFIDPPTQYSHIALGGTKTQIKDPTDVPGEFEFRRVIARGPCRRGMMANCADLLIEDCDFDDYYDPNSDSQAITGWNGAFRHRILRTRLGAASYNIAYGGSDAASEVMFPRDITIEGCLLVKKPEWKGKYRIKNGFEMKNGFNVLFARNTIDGVWADANGGWPQGVAIIVNTANQENTNPTARVENLVILENVIRNVGCYLQIIGKNAGPYPSGTSKGIRVFGNKFETMHLEGNGHAADIIDGPEDVEIAHNTFAENRHSFIQFGGTYATSKLVFRDNIARHGVHGLIDGNGATLAAILGRLDLRGNALEVKSGTQPQDVLPPTNLYYPAPILSQNLSAHVTSDGIPVGA